MIGCVVEPTENPFATIISQAQFVLFCEPVTPTSGSYTFLLLADHTCVTDVDWN